MRFGVVQRSETRRLSRLVATPISFVIPRVPARRRGCRSYLRFVIEHACILKVAGEHVLRLGVGENDCEMHCYAFDDDATTTAHRSGLSGGQVRRPKRFQIEKC